MVGTEEMQTLLLSTFQRVANRLASELEAEQNEDAKQLFANCLTNVVQPELFRLGSDLTPPTKGMLSTINRKKSKRANDAHQEVMSVPDLLAIILQKAGLEATISFCQTSNEMRQLIKAANKAARLKVNLNPFNIKIKTLTQIQKSELWTITGADFRFGRVKSALKNLKFLSSFTDLVFLDLKHTNANDLTPIAVLTELKQLNLNHTHVTDLMPIAGLTKLLHLHLDHTNVTDLTPIAGLTKLLHLHLGHTNVTDLTPISGLTELKQLMLDQTNVTDLTPIAGLTKLKRLSLIHTNVTDLTQLADLVGPGGLSVWHAFDTAT